MRLVSYIALLGLVLENVFTALWNLTEEETTTTELPSNIVLTEILPRLPTKLLGRCINGPVGEGKCNESFLIGRPPALSQMWGLNVQSEKTTGIIYAIYSIK
ncbi:hypothetical protein Tco_0901984 [Tanacetum coccineum]